MVVVARFVDTMCRFCVFAVFSRESAPLILAELDPVTRGGGGARHRYITSPRPPELILTHVFRPILARPRLLLERHPQTGLEAPGLSEG
jgi:hypothetical protein